jgi:hypothetical protein
MNSTATKLALVSAIAAIIAGCGGGDSSSGAAPSTSNTSTPPVTSAPQTANVALLLSDASTEDWATIGVKVMSIALVPQGGGSNVTVYTAPAMAPTVNLAQLDQIAEILGNVSVPVGTYTAAVLTVSGNDSDILLTVAADPEAGFAAPAGTTISAGQIQVQHTQGTGTSLTVPIDVNFATPLVVSATQSNALDLEFDLSHPAFIVGHVPPAAGGATIWAVNFDGPVHHHPLHDLTRLVLRHTYGNVTAIASDNSSITITKEFPTEPAVNPETAVATSQSLTILADATNGTLFYDLDAKTQSVIKDFSSEAALTGKSVRVAARYQEDGTLVATRIWASSTFSTVWVSPEGHVLHVNPNTNVVTVANESGVGIPLTINANTQFFFRQPQNAVADGTPIGSGTSFISNHDFVRGFKVHASVVDPLATPLVAQSIDIETAEYDGTISAPSMTGFTYTRTFHTASDDYNYAADYIADATANGTDANGNAITGYKWWNFAYPTMLMSGATAITDFIAATNGSVNMERSRQSRRLGRGRHGAAAVHFAVGHSGDRPRERYVHPECDRRQHAGHRRREHRFGISHVGVPSGSHEQYREREFHRRHDQRRSRHGDRRARGGRAGESLRGAARRRNAARVRPDLLHGRDSRAITSHPHCRSPHIDGLPLRLVNRRRVALSQEPHGAFASKLVATPTP